MKILVWKNPALKCSATPVPIEEIQNGAAAYILDRMYLTMLEANGIGLAANQIGLTHRYVVMHDSATETAYKMINPMIVQASTQVISITEGCLSFPGVINNPIRAKSVQAVWTDQNGNEQSASFEGLMAVCMQHEIDHLNGITFVDGWSDFKIRRAIHR